LVQPVDGGKGVATIVSSLGEQRFAIICAHVSKLER